MTVVGAIIGENDHIVAWADSEVFRWDGSPTGRDESKLAVNAFARLFGSGAGWGDLVDAAERVVHRARSFDDAVARLPEALRQAALRSVKVQKRDPHGFAGCSYFVVGFSDAYGRPLACRFDGSAFFVPLMTARVLLPAIDTPGSFCCAQDVIDLAIAQIIKLRDECPLATGGSLTIGTMSPDGIGITIHPDFAPAALSVLEDVTS